MTREQAYRRYIKEYDIEVPEERVQEMYDYFLLQTKHNMQYDTLINGAVHLHKARELAEMEDEMREAAWFEAKSDLVMKELMKQLDPEVTEEELQAKAEEKCRKDGTTMDMLKMFFGPSLSGLKRDLQEEKIKDYIHEQMNKA
jgi:FKBP-type peptidyl-prolyl cis-trans isomerase (trigger factor)